MSLIRIIRLPAGAAVSFKARCSGCSFAARRLRGRGRGGLPSEATLFAALLLAIEDDKDDDDEERDDDVAADGARLTNARVFIRAEKGGGDGLRVDVDGNLWCGWAGGEGLDGVMILNKGGEPIGRIDLPERCANVCFGGYRRSRLFMVASRSLYALWVGTSGAFGG